MKINEVLNESKEKLEDWDEVDEIYNPEAMAYKNSNPTDMDFEDQEPFTNEPENEECASNGYRGLKEFEKTL